MNSNVVYGATVCHNGTSSTDYQNYHHPELAYYSTQADLAVATSNGVGSGAPNHYVSPLHMSNPGTHQFSEPAGIINETNGLSYTNLDTQQNYPNNSVPPHHQRLSHYGDLRGSSISQGPSLGPSVVQGPSQLTIAPNHQSYSHQYRDFTHSESTHLTSGHQEMIFKEVPVLSDCAAVRPGVNCPPVSTGQYPSYLDSNLLARRSGGSLNQTALHSTYSDPTSPSIDYKFDVTCNQLNGNPYHLNHHLASHLHHSQHHLHHYSHASVRQQGNNSVISAAPVPQYKWMQVKRNVPKPSCKLIL